MRFKVKIVGRLHLFYSPDKLFNVCDAAPVDLLELLDEVVVVLDGLGPAQALSALVARPIGLEVQGVRGEEVALAAVHAPDGGRVGTKLGRVGAPA